MLQAEAETKMVQSKCQKYTDMCKLENTELFRFLLKESEDKIGVNMKEHVENVKKRLTALLRRETDEKVSMEIKERL